ncbi:hypothetical protein BJ165DRAFT_680938 [Panaeolus papilionaceus]|nr:hypothetical protein BJ165DRAFT_680938 [Panaeolus papilionaceus]
MIEASTSDDVSILVLEYCVVVAMILGGIIFTNTLSYYRRYTNDHIYLKYFVGTLWTVEVAQTIVAASSIAHISTWHRNHSGERPPLPEAVSRCLILSFICTGIIVSMVQGFFSHRLRILTDSWTLPSICWLLTFLRCVGIFVLGMIPLVRRYQLLVWLGKQKAVISTILAASIAIDIMVTASLTIVLYKRKNIGFQSLQHVINRLITWSIMSGLITTLLTAAILILSVMKQSVIYFGAFLVLARVFGLIFILSLNERRMLRRLDESALGSTLPAGIPVFAAETRTSPIPEPDDAAQTETGVRNGKH